MWLRENLISSRWILPGVLIGVALRRTHPPRFALSLLITMVALSSYACWLIYRSWPSSADRVEEGSLNAHIGTIFGSFMLSCGLYGTYVCWDLVIHKWPTSVADMPAG